MTRVVSQQLAPRLGDLAANRCRTTEAIRQGVDLGASVVVLPELATCGYVFASPQEASQVAITPQHLLFTEWATEAGRGDALVIGGFCEQGDDGLLYNSACVVDGSGVRTVYRKTHLWDREKLIFAAGKEEPPVLDAAIGRIGVLICYDLEFPEMTRSLALAGADLVVVPANPVFSTRKRCVRRW